MGVRWSMAIAFIVQFFSLLNGLVNATSTTERATSTLNRRATSSHLPTPTDIPLVSSNSDLCPSHDDVNLATYYQGAASDTFQVACGVDFYGDDLFTQPTQVRNGALGCLAECDRTAGCIAASFSEGVQGSGVGDCYLKSSHSLRVEKLGIVSVMRKSGERPEMTLELPGWDADGRSSLSGEPIVGSTKLRTSLSASFSDFYPTTTLSSDIYRTASDASKTSTSVTTTNSMVFSASSVTSALLPVGPLGMTTGSQISVSSERDHTLSLSSGLETSSSGFYSAFTSTSTSVYGIASDTPEAGSSVVPVTNTLVLNVTTATGNPLPVDTLRVMTSSPVMNVTPSRTVSDLPDFSETSSTGSISSLVSLATQATSSPPTFSSQGHYTAITDQTTSSRSGSQSSIPVVTSSSAHASTFESQSSSNASRIQLASSSKVNETVTLLSHPLLTSSRKRTSKTVSSETFRPTMTPSRSSSFKSTHEVPHTVMSPSSLKTGNLESAAVATNTRLAPSSLVYADSTIASTPRSKSTSSSASHAYASSFVLDSTPSLSTTFKPHYVNTTAGLPHTASEHTTVISSTNGASHPSMQSSSLRHAHTETVIGQTITAGSTSMSSSSNHPSSSSRRGRTTTKTTVMTIYGKPPKSTFTKGRTTTMTRLVTLQRPTSLFSWTSSSLGNKRPSSLVSLPSPSISVRSTSATESSAIRTSAPPPTSSEQPTGSSAPTPSASSTCVYSNDEDVLNSSVRIVNGSYYVNAHPCATSEQHAQWQPAASVLPADVLSLFNSGKANYFHAEGDYVYYVKTESHSTIIPVMAGSSLFLEQPNASALKCSHCYDGSETGWQTCPKKCRPVVKMLSSWSKVNVTSHWSYSAYIGKGDFTAVKPTATSPKPTTVTMWKQVSTTATIVKPITVTEYQMTSAHDPVVTTKTIACASSPGGTTTTVLQPTTFLQYASPVTVQPYPSTVTGVVQTTLTKTVVVSHVTTETLTWFTPGYGPLVTTKTLACGSCAGGKTETVVTTQLRTETVPGKTFEASKQTKTVASSLQQSASVHAPVAPSLRPTTSTKEPALMTSKKPAIGTGKHPASAVSTVSPSVFKATATAARTGTGETTSWLGPSYSIVKTSSTTFATSVSSFPVSSAAAPDTTSKPTSSQSSTLARTRTSTIRPSHTQTPHSAADTLNPPVWTTLLAVLLGCLLHT